MDCDGWVFLTGRFKEIINRGGEKISPSSIEEAVLGFADVHSCLVFGFPDAELGEDIGLMVVLKSEAMAFSLASIRKSRFSGVASFKLPSLLIFAKYLPVGPTRKPLRIGLHAKLGLDFSQATFTHKLIAKFVPRELTCDTNNVLQRSDLGGCPPSHSVNDLVAIQTRICDIFAASGPRPTVTDNFASLGIDSVKSALVSAKLIQAFPQISLINAMNDDVSTLANRVINNDGVDVGAGLVISPLQGLQVLGSMIVMLEKSTFCGCTSPQFVYGISHLAPMWMTIFLIISGILTRLKDDRLRLRLFRSQACSILPLHWISIVAMAPFEPRIYSRFVVFELLLVDNWIPATLFAPQTYQQMMIFYPSWFLSSLLLFSLCYKSLRYFQESVFGTSSLLQLAFALFILSSLSVPIPLKLTGSLPRTARTLYHWSPMSLPTLCAGMAVAQGLTVAKLSPVSRRRLSIGVDVSIPLLFVIPALQFIRGFHSIYLVEVAFYWSHIIPLGACLFWLMLCANALRACIVLQGTTTTSAVRAWNLHIAQADHFPLHQIKT